MSRLFYKTTRLERTGQSPMELSLAKLSWLKTNTSDITLYKTVGQYYVLAVQTKQHTSAMLFHNAEALLAHCEGNVLETRVVNDAGICKKALD